METKKTALTEGRMVVLIAINRKPLCEVLSLFDLMGGLSTQFV